jgi:ArsR family transcriptional regulator
MIDRETVRQRAEVLKALAHESRLLMVHRLGEGECTAGDLVDLVGSDASTVSKHLALLRRHGIVSDRREGSHVVYSLRTPCVLEFFGCASRVIEAFPR